MSIDLLKQIAIGVYDKVHPLIGKKEGAKELQKGAGGDISMFIDILAEETIFEILERNRVNTQLISEEVGERSFGDKAVTENNRSKLIIDPIDGSNNAVRGIPYCSISIAYAEGNYIKDIKYAVILDLITKDIFWAEKGKGAFMNELKINALNSNSLNRLIFELDIPTSMIFKNLDKLKNIFQKAYLIRVLGSTALTLCQMAKGSIDVFLNFNENNRIVDIAAGFLILKEAGGSFFSLDNSDLDEKSLSIKTKFPFFACIANLEEFLKKEIEFL